MKFAGRKTLFYSVLSVFPLFMVARLLFLLATSKQSLLILTDKLFWHSLRFSVYQALLSTLLSLVLALLLSALVANRRFLARSLLRQLYLPSLVIAQLIFIIGYLKIFAENGLLHTITGLNFPLSYNYTAIIIAHVIYNTALPWRLFWDHLEQLPQAYYDEAEINGLQGFALFWYVQLPQLLPLILALIPLVFVPCFFSYTIPLILGGSPAYTSVELLINQLLLRNHFGQGALIIFFEWLIVIVVIFLSSLAYRFFEKPLLIKEKENKLRASNDAVQAFLILFAFIFALPFITPLFIGILKLSNLSWLNWINIVAMLRSFILAFFVALSGLFLALSLWELALKKRSKELSEKTSSFLLIFSPMSLTLLLGGTQLSSSPLWRFFLLYLVHTLLTLPLALRLVFAALKSIATALEETLLLEGASYWLQFKVKLSLIQQPLYRTFLLSMALSLGEFVAAQYLLPSTTPTLPLRIYELLSHYGFEQTMVLAMLQCLIFVVVALSGRFFIKYLWR